MTRRIPDSEPHPIPETRMNETKIIPLEEPISIKNLVETLEKADGYMVSFTTLKAGQLQHHYFTKDFQIADLLKSHSLVKQLILEDLEK